MPKLNLYRIEVLENKYNEKQLTRVIDYSVNCSD